MAAIQQKSDDLAFVDHDSNNLLTVLKPQRLKNTSHKTT